MTDTRLFDSTSWWRSRRRYSSLLLAILGAYGLLLAGCSGQQAESIRSKKDLNDQIVQMKKENAKLKYEVDREKEAREEAEKQAEALIAENKRYMPSRGDSDPATQHIGPSVEEEFGALIQATPEPGDPLESSTPEPDDPLGSSKVEDVEKVPEHMVIAKVKPSGPVEEQLARIMEEELAAAVAGLEDIFFEFDSWKITEAGKDVLEKNANLLQEDTDLTLLIEGHCDQRGTHAYNIVLGKKRAVAIRDYLVFLGVEPRRLFVITYGKEKPFCKTETEECYQENRRGHLLVR